MNKGLAECAGLWLAEGDQKTIREITFTNNELSLVKLFHHNLQNTFDLTNLCPRIYVYSAKGAKLRFPKMKINYYTDKRARKPYFLYRVASRNLVQEWKKIVEGVLGKEEFYADILRGFFAGEGLERVKI